MSASHPLIAQIEAAGKEGISVTTAGAMPFQFIESKDDTLADVNVCTLVVFDHTNITHLHFGKKKVFGDADVSSYAIAEKIALPSDVANPANVSLTPALGGNQKVAAIVTLKKIRRSGAKEFIVSWNTAALGVEDFFLAELSYGNSAAAVESLGHFGIFPEISSFSVSGSIVGPAERLLAHTETNANDFLGNGLKLNAAGSGYAVGDELTLTGGNADAKVQVLSVNSGAITSFALKKLGSGYTGATGVDANGGNGTGATFDTIATTEDGVNTGFVVCNKFVSEFSVAAQLNTWSTSTLNAAKVAFAASASAASYHEASAANGVFSHRILPAASTARLLEISRAMKVTLVSATVQAGAANSEEFVRITPNAAPDHEGRLIGAIATVSGKDLRVVCSEAGDIVLRRLSLTAGDTTTLADADFNNCELTLVGLEPQVGVSDASVIRTESFYGIPSAQALDARATNYSATHSVQLVSGAQEDHVVSPAMSEMSLKLPVELRHNKADAGRGTINSLVFPNPGAISYANDEIRIVDDKNRFPLAAGAGESLDQESAIEARHSGNNRSLDFDGTLKHITKTSGGSGYTDGTYVLDGGDRNAFVQVTTHDDATAEVTNKTLTGKSSGTAGQGYEVGDVLGVDTKSNGTGDNTTLLTLRVNEVQNTIAQAGITLADADIRESSQTVALNIEHGKVTYTAALTNIVAGMVVSGDHIQMGTTVESIDANAGTLTLSKAPLGTKQNVDLTFKSAAWDELVAPVGTEFQLNNTTHEFKVATVKTAATGVPSLTTGTIAPAGSQAGPAGAGQATHGSFERTQGKGYTNGNTLTANNIAVDVTTTKNEVETVTMVADVLQGPASHGSGTGYAKDDHLTLTGGALVNVDAVINELNTITTSNLTTYTEGVVGTRGSGYANGAELKLLTGDEESKCPTLVVNGIKSIVDANSIQILDQGAGYTDTAEGASLNLNGTDGGTFKITTKDILEEALIQDGGDGYAVGDEVTVGDATIKVLKTESRLQKVEIATAGSGYAAGDVLTIGTDAKVAITQVHDTVDTVAISASGSGYRANDEVTVGDATMTVGTAVESTLEGITIVDDGSGYTNESVIEIGDARAKLTTGDELKRITQIDASGAGYSAGQEFFICTDATVKVTQVQDTLDSVEDIVSGGSGYTTTDGTNVAHLTIGDGQIKIDAVQDTLTGVTITDGGQGFSVGDTITGHNLNDVTLSVKRVTDVNNVANVTIAADTTASASGSQSFVDGNNKARINIETASTLDSVSFIGDHADNRGLGFDVGEVHPVGSSDASVRITQINATQNTIDISSEHETTANNTKKLGATAKDFGVTFTQKGVAAESVISATTSGEATTTPTETQVGSDEITTFTVNNVRAFVDSKSHLSTETVVGKNEYTVTTENDGGEDASPLTAQQTVARREISAEGTTLMILTLSADLTTNYDSGTTVTQGGNEVTLDQAANVGENTLVVTYNANFTDGDITVGGDTLTVDIDGVSGEMKEFVIVTQNNDFASPYRFTDGGDHDETRGSDTLANLATSLGFDTFITSAQVYKGGSLLLKLDEDVDATNFKVIKEQQFEIALPDTVWYKRTKVDGTGVALTLAATGGGNAFSVATVTASYPGGVHDHSVNKDPDLKTAFEGADVDGNGVDLDRFSFSGSTESGTTTLTIRVKVTDVTGLTLTRAAVPAMTKFESITFGQPFTLTDGDNTYTTADSPADLAGLKTSLETALNGALSISTSGSNLFVDETSTATMTGNAVSGQHQVAITNFSANQIYDIHVGDDARIENTSTATSLTDLASKLSSFGAPSVNGNTLTFTFAGAQTAFTVKAPFIAQIDELTVPDVASYHTFTFNGVDNNGDAITSDNISVTVKTSVDDLATAIGTNATNVSVSESGGKLRLTYPIAKPINVSGTRLTRAAVQHQLTYSGVDATTGIFTVKNETTTALSANLSDLTGKLNTLPTGTAFTDSFAVSNFLDGSVGGSRRRVQVKVGDGITSQITLTSTEAGELESFTLTDSADTYSGGAWNGTVYAGVTYASITATITNGGVTRNITVTGSNVGDNAQDPSTDDGVIHTYTLDEPLVIAVGDACVVDWTSTSNAIINYTEINGFDTTPLALDASGSVLPYAFSASGDDILLTWNDNGLQTVTISDYKLVRHALRTFNVTGLLTSDYNGYPWSLDAGATFSNVKTATEIKDMVAHDSVNNVFSPNANTVQVVFHKDATVIDTVLQRGTQKTKLEINLGAHGPTANQNQTVYTFSDGTQTLITSHDAASMGDLQGLLNAEQTNMDGKPTFNNDGNKLLVELGAYANNVNVPTTTYDYTSITYTLTRVAQYSVQTIALGFTQADFVGRTLKLRTVTDEAQTSAASLSVAPTLANVVTKLNDITGLPFTVAADGTAANLKLTYNEVGPQSVITSVLEAAAINGIPLAMEVAHAGFLWSGDKNKNDVEDFVGISESGLKIQTTGLQNRVTSATLVQSPDEGATLTVSTDGGVRTITNTAHGLSAGDKVTVENAINGENNGVFAVTVTGANTFTLGSASSKAETTVVRWAATTGAHTFNAGVLTAGSLQIVPVTNHNRVAEIEITDIANQTTDTKKNNTSLDNLASNGGGSGLALTTVGRMGEVKLVSLESGGTDVNSAKHNQTGAYPEGGSGSGLQVKTNGTLGKVSELIVLDGGSALDATKNDATVDVGAGGLKVNTGGKIGYVKSIAITNAGTADGGANDNKNKNSASYTMLNDAANNGSLQINTTGTLGKVTSLSVKDGGNTAVNSNKDSANVFPEGGQGTGLKITTSGTMGVPVQVAVTSAGSATAGINSAKKYDQGLTKAANASATEYSGGSGTGLTLKTNVGETNTMNTVTQLEVTLGGSQKNPLKASGTDNATYTGGSGSGLTFRTRGTIGALKSVELVSEGTAATTTATYTIPSNIQGGTGTGKIGWAAISGVPTGVSIKNEAAARGDLSLTPSANIRTKVVTAANHSVSHPSFHLPAATYRMGVVKTFSLIGAGEGATPQTATANGGSDRETNDNTNAKFTTTVRGGVPKTVVYSNRGTAAAAATAGTNVNLNLAAEGGGTGAQLAKIETQQNVIASLSNEKLTTNILGDFPSTTTSRLATRFGGGDDVHVQYEVKVGEITKASAIDTHAGQTALENADKLISKSYRLTAAGSGYTVSANAVALGALKIEVTQVNSGNGAIERFRILEDAAVGTYTDNKATIVISAAGARGSAPRVDSTTVSGVIKTFALTHAGSNYGSSGTMGLTSIQSDGQTANPGSGATFGVTGFLSVKQSTYNGDGAFEIVGDASGLSQAMKTELATPTGAYTFYQVHPTLYSRSAYPNTAGKNYDGFSVARRTIYVDGNSERNSSMGGALTVPSTGSASNAFKIATVDASNSTDPLLSVSNLKIWEREGAASTTHDEIVVAPSINNRDIVFTMHHKSANIVHHVSAVQFTVTVKQAMPLNGMHTAELFVETFDVFLHTVAAPFLRVTKSLSNNDSRYETTLDNMNLTTEKELSWKFWSDGSNFTDAKDANKGFATMELEAGEGTYQTAMASECLFVAKIDGDVAYFAHADPSKPTRRLRGEASNNVLAVDRSIAEMIRRIATHDSDTSAAKDIKLKVGAAEFLMKRHKDTEVSVASSANGSSVGVTQVDTHNTAKYYTVTTAAAHGLKSGDWASFSNNAEGVVLFVESATKFGLYSAQAPATKVYNDQSLLRIRFKNTALATPPAVGNHLDLSASKIGTATLDMRAFNSAQTNDVITFTANSAVWDRSLSSGHNEPVFLIDHQESDLRELAASVNLSDGNHTLADVDTNAVVGDLVVLEKAGMANAEARITSVGAAFKFEIPSEFENKDGVKVSLKGVSYAVDRKSLRMHVTAAPSAYDHFGVGELYKPNTGAITSTLVVNLPEQASFYPVSSAQFDLMKASNAAPQAPMGPLRAGPAMSSAYALTAPSDHMEAAGETDSEANMFLGKITYKTKSDGASVTYQGKATFTLDSVSDTYFTDIAKEISPTASTLSLVSVGQVTNKDQNFVTDHYKINSWETNAAGTEILTFGQVETETRSTMSFSSDSVLNRVKLVMPNLTAVAPALAQGDSIVQYDVDGKHIVAKGTVEVVSNNTVDFFRNWGVDFTLEKDGQGNVKNKMSFDGGVLVRPHPDSRLMTHISFTGSAKDMDESHKLTTGSEGFVYLDHAESANDTNLRIFSADMRAIGSTLHKIHADNRRFLTQMSVPLTVLNRGAEYAVDDVITLGGNADDQTLKVVAVDTLGGVARFRLTNSKAASKGYAPQKSATGSGSGFVAYVGEVGNNYSMKATFSTDTTGLASDTDGASNGMLFHHEASGTDYEHDVELGVGEIHDFGTNMYERLYKTVDLESASIRMVPGYDYPALRYSPMSDESDIELTTFRNPRFEFADHGSFYMLHPLDQGGLDTEGSGVSVSVEGATVYAGTNYAPMDVLECGGLKLIVREVKTVQNNVTSYLTGLSDRGSISRVEVLSGSRQTGNLKDATGGNGSGAKFDIDNPVASLRPARAVYMSDNNRKAELRAIAYSSDHKRHEASINSRGVAGGYVCKIDGTTTTIINMSGTQASEDVFIAPASAASSQTINVTRTNDSASGKNISGSIASTYSRKILHITKASVSVSGPETSAVSTDDRWLRAQQSRNDFVNIFAPFQNLTTGSGEGTITTLDMGTSQRASVDSGSNQSATVTLTSYLDAPPPELPGPTVNVQIFDSNGNMDMMNGSTIKLYVNNTSGNINNNTGSSLGTQGTTLHYQWYKNGEPLMGAITHTLDMSQHGDGKYYASVSDDNGTTYSQSFSFGNIRGGTGMPADKTLAILGGTQLKLSYDAGMDFLQPYGTEVAYKVTVKAKRTLKLRTSLQKMSDEWGYGKFETSINDTVHLTQAESSATVRLTRSKTVGVRKTAYGFNTDTVTDYVKGDGTHAKFKDYAASRFGEEIVPADCGTQDASFSGGVQVDAVATKKTFKFTPSTGTGFDTASNEDYVSRYDMGKLHRDIPFKVEVNGAKVKITPVGVFKNVLEDEINRKDGNGTPNGSAVLNITAKVAKTNMSPGNSENYLPNTASITNTGANEFDGSWEIAKEILANPNASGVLEGRGSSLQMVFGGYDYELGDALAVDGSGAQIEVTRVHPETGKILAYKITGNWTSPNNISAGIHTPTYPNGVNGTGKDAMFRVVPNAHLTEYTATMTLGSGQNTVDANVVFHYASGYVKYVSCKYPKEMVAINPVLPAPSNTVHTYFAQESHNSAVVANNWQKAGSVLTLKPNGNGDINHFHLVEAKNSSGAESKYQLAMKDNITIGNNVTLSFKQADSNVTQMGQNVSFANDDASKRTGEKDAAKRFHLKTADLNTNVTFADYNSTNNSYVDVISSVDHISAGSGALKFVNAPNMDESVGRVAVIIATTEPEYDGPNGLARARDAMWLSVYDAYSIGTMNHRVAAPYITTKGVGYRVDDILTLAVVNAGANNETSTSIKVTEVDSMGGVLGYEVHENDVPVAAQEHDLSGGSGKDAKLKMDAVNNAGTMVHSYAFNDQYFPGITHKKVHVLSDFLPSGTAKKTISASGTGDLRDAHDGNGRPQSDLVLTLSASKGFKSLGWDSGNDESLAITNEEINTTLEVVGDISVTQSDVEALPKDMEQTSLSGEAMFYVQHGRRLSGRATDHTALNFHPASLRADAITGGLGVLLFEVNDNNLVLSTYYKGENYTAGDLLSWGDSLITVDAVDNNGAITSWSVTRGGYHHAYSTKAVGGSGTTSATSPARFQIATGVTAKVTKILLPGLQMGSGSTRKTEFKLSSKSDARLLNGSQEDHESSVKDVEVVVLPNLSDHIRVADKTELGSLAGLTSAPGQSGEVFTDDVERTFCKYQKLWRADGNMFTGLYLNGSQWSTTDGVVSKSGAKSSNLLRAKATTLPSGLTLMQDIDDTLQSFATRVGHFVGRIMPNASLVETSVNHNLSAGDVVVFTNATNTSGLNTVHKVVSVQDAQGNDTPKSFTIAASAGANKEYVTIHTQAPFSRQADSNAAKIDLIPNGYTGSVALSLKQTGVSLKDTQLAVNHAVAKLGGGIDLNDDADDSAPDVTLIYAGDSNWELARTDALVSGNTDGHSAKSYEFESYKGLVLNQGGSGYRVNDLVIITNTQAGGTVGKVRVTAVDGDSQEGGAILSFELDESGSKYIVAANVGSAHATGSGATFDINRVKDDGSLHREFETDYIAASETNLTDTNDNGNYQTVAAEKYSVSNAIDDDDVAFSYNLPSVLKLAGDYLSGKDISFMLKSGSSGVFEESIFRVSSSLKATVPGYSRPMALGSTADTFTKKRAGREAIDHWLLPNDSMFAAFSGGDTASESVSLKLTLSESVVPHYSIMRKPTLDSKDVVDVITSSSNTKTPINTTMASYQTSNCDHLLLFTNRNDIGGSSANDRATAFEDRAIVDLEKNGVRSAYSEGSAVIAAQTNSTLPYRRFDSTVSDNGEVAINLTTRGSTRFFKLDTSSLNYDAKKSEVDIAGTFGEVRFKDTNGADYAHGLTIGHVGTYVTIAKQAATVDTGCPGFIYQPYEIDAILNTTSIRFKNADADGNRISPNDSSSPVTNVEASYGFANETSREIRVLGANSGSLTSASATSSHISGNPNKEDVLRFRASATHQPMDINSITGSGVTVENITGATGAGQTSDNRRFPAASGILGKAVGSVDNMRVGAVAGQSYSNGSFSLFTFANEDTGVTVAVSGSSFTASGTPNSKLTYDIDYRLDNNGPLVDVDALVAASAGMPGHTDSLSIVNAGSGYVAGNQLWLCNKSKPLGKDRVLITVASENAQGAISSFTAAFPDGQATSRVDGSRWATEPVYELNEELHLETIGGSGSGATMKFISQVPRVRISARKQHPFYIYTEIMNKINLEILSNLSLTTTDASARAVTNRVALHRSNTVPTSVGAYQISAAIKENALALGDHIYGQSTSLANEHTTTLTEDVFAVDTSIFVENTNFIAVGARIIVGSGSTTEIMIVTDIDGKKLTVFRGKDTEPLQNRENRNIAIAHDAGATVMLDASRFYTQGDTRIRFTQPVITTTTSNANKVHVTKVVAGDDAIGQSYYVYANPSLRSTFRNENNGSLAQVDIGKITHIVWNAGVTVDGKQAATVIGNVTVTSANTQLVGGDAALSDRYTVTLQTMSAGGIQFDATSNGTRATLLSVQRSDDGIGDFAVSKPMHLTPVSREVHLDGFQLRTLPTGSFGATNNSGTDNTEPDDLTNSYASGKFDINSYLVRRSSEVPQVEDIAWNRTAGGSAYVDMTVPAAAIAADESGLNIFSLNGKSVANTKRDILLTGTGTDKYLVVFGGSQLMSGYYTLTSCTQVSGDATKYNARFTVLDSNWTDSRKETVDNGDLTKAFGDMEVLFLRCSNSGKDWTYPDPTNDMITRQKSSYKSGHLTRTNEPTLLAESTGFMTGTFHGSSTVAGQANLPAGEFASAVGNNTSTQTLVNRQQHLTPHSNGIDSGNTASGLGTIPMMTDERRVYRIFSKTNLSRFSTDVFKLIDLPTRIDMRDVIVSVIRPRSVNQTSDPEEDILDRADIMVFGQLADFSNLVRQEPEGDAVRILHPKNAPARSEMPFTKRDADVAGNGGNGMTVDAMMRYQTHSFPMALHPQNSVPALNYRMSCPSVLGQGDASGQTQLSNCSLATTGAKTGTITFTFNDNRETGLEVGDRVVVTTANVNAPNGADFEGSTHYLHSGRVTSVSAVTVGAPSSININVTFDEDIPQKDKASVFVTVSSRTRLVLNRPRTMAVLTPSWGFRNDAVHGTTAPVNSSQEMVRNGTYVVGVNDAQRSNAVLSTTTQFTVGNMPSHMSVNQGRDHPFGLNNLANMIPGHDIFEL